MQYYYAVGKPFKLKFGKIRNIFLAKIYIFVKLMIFYNCLVYLYQCRRTARLCGSCVGSDAKVEYKCGWCVSTSSCSVRDGCSSGQWVNPLGKCPKEPQIQSVCLIYIFSLKLQQRFLIVFPALTFATKCCP